MKKLTELLSSPRIPVPLDKQAHFNSGGILALIAYFFIGYYALLLVMVVAFAKEIDGTGVELVGSGVEVDFSGVEVDFSGVELDGSGVELDGSGVELVDVGVELVGVGVELVGVGVELDGVGVELVGVGVELVGVGVELDGVGVELVGTGVELVDDVFVEIQTKELFFCGSDLHSVLHSQQEPHASNCLHKST